MVTFEKTILVAFFSALSTVTAGAIEPLSIGSGDPGLKVATRIGDSNAIVIYQDEPYTVGSGGLGGMKNRTINVIADRGYHFRKETANSSMEIPQQLYPFDLNSAFTSEIGARDPEAKEAVANQAMVPWPVGYRLVNGQLTIFTNIQKEAEVTYHLNSDAVFLGFIDGRIFFCKRGFRPPVAFWKTLDDQKEYSYAMPRGVVDVFGVTRGMKHDIGFVVLRKATWRLHPTPYENDFIEVSLSSGKPARPNKSLQATRDGALSSASRLTLVGPACLSSGR